MEAILQPWKKAPLLRLAIALIAGIITSLQFDILPLKDALLLSTVFLSLFIYAHIKFQSLGYSYRWLPGFLMTLSVFFAGNALLISHKADKKPNYFGNYQREGAQLVLYLTEPLQEKETNYKTIAEVKSVYLPGKVIPCSGKVLLYFEKSDRARALQYGDVILVHIPASLIEPPKNPEEFDFRAYMALQNIYHNVRLSDEDFISSGKNEGSGLWRLMYSTRQKWSDYIKESIGGKDEQAIARALVLGDVSDISPEVVNDYAASGTLHVLSVSGLHIGAIFLVLNFMLGFLKRNKAGRVSRILLLLSFLWGYAFLTGLSAAVCRSAAMFSFVIIGQDLRRLTSIYNSVATSAIALLLWDPFLIAQIGFQLSYIALIGIVWLYPSIHSLLDPGKALRAKTKLNKFGNIFNKAYTWLFKAAWGIVAMSTAAQLATMPLGFYYFNRFPTYFLVANLVVIPWSTLILFGGCLFIVIRLLNLGFLYGITGKALYGVIHGMNFMVNREQALPGAQLQGIYLGVFHCCILYAIIFLLATAFIYKNKSFLKYGLVLCLVLVSVRIVARIFSYRDNHVLLHSIPHSFVMSIKEGGKLYILADSSFISDKRKLNYYISRYGFKNYIAIPDVSCITTNKIIHGAGFWYHDKIGQYDSKKFIIIDKSFQPGSISGYPEFDVVVLHDDPDIDIKSFVRNIMPARIIISPVNNMFKVKKWADDCKRLGIPFYDAKSGCIEI